MYPTSAPGPAPRAHRGTSALCVRCPHQHQQRPRAGQLAMADFSRSATEPYFVLNPGFYWAKIMMLQGVGHSISCLGVCCANDPPKGAARRRLVRGHVSPHGIRSCISWTRVWISFGALPCSGMDPSTRSRVVVWGGREQTKLCTDAHQETTRAYLILELTGTPMPGRSIIPSAAAHARGR